MTRTREVMSLATAALLLAVITACAESGGDPPSRTASTSASPTTNPPTSASPSSTPQTPSEGAAAAAAAVVREYFRVIDQLRQRPRTPLSTLDRVATSGELSAQQIFLRSERRKSLHQVGDTHIADLKVQSVNLDESAPESGEVPTAQVDVCWDVSEVDLIDRSGQSVVSPSRPDIGWIRFTVSNHHWSVDPNGGWRVASGQDLERTPCTAS